MLHRDVTNLLRNRGGERPAGRDRLSILGGLDLCPRLSSPRQAQELRLEAFAMSWAADVTHFVQENSPDPFGGWWVRVDIDRSNGGVAVAGSTRWIARWLAVDDSIGRYAPAEELAVQLIKEQLQGRPL